MGGRRVFKRQDVLRRWRLPTARQWLALALALGAVLLTANALSLWVVTRSKAQVAQTLWRVAEAPLREPRGVVLPLFDGNALLGISLIMELRAMQIDLPIEAPHCGDLSDKFIDRLAHDEQLNVRVYDVCIKAAEAYEVGAMGNRMPLFCDELDICYKRFRSFDIKILALFFSRFEELMLLDADVMFLQNPMSLWDSDKFVRTGTLFFPDRISVADEFLAERVGDKPEPVPTNDQGEPVSKRAKKDLPTRSRLHEFVENFNRAPFQRLANVPRTTESADHTVKHGQHKPSAAAQGRESAFRQQGVEPSAFLRHTHAWNLRAGHQADSSLLLWSKVKQPRATAILGSFVSLRHAYRPPSYGEKEFYFIACEVADSDYAFSDFGVGTIGSDRRTNERALCGDTLHFYPVKSPLIKDDDAIPPLFINSAHIAIWNPDKEVFYRSNTRLADHYPGSFVERNLPEECLFDVKAIPLTEREIESFRRRQKFYKTVESWQHKASAGRKTPARGKR